MDDRTDNVGNTDAIRLPDALWRRFNGQLDGQTVVAWAEFDLDPSNRYRSQHVVLTERDLIVLTDTQSVSIQLNQIEETKINEGLGVDRLAVISGGKLVSEMRYSRRFRRDMTRLHRKLARRIPNKDGKEHEAAPDWLESVERKVEQQEHCPKCGQLIPAYAEGVCPQCLRKRKILWRLLDVAKPYRPRIWSALAPTLLVSFMATIPPYCLKHLMDDAILGQRLDLLWKWAAVLIAI